MAAFSSTNINSPQALKILEIVLAADDGCRTSDVVRIVKAGTKSVKNTLGALKQAGRVSITGKSTATRWCAPGKEAPIYDAFLAGRRQRKRDASAASKARRNNPACALTGDTPVVRRIVQTWPPLRHPPGPPSVFHYGGPL